MRQDFSEERPLAKVIRAIRSRHGKSGSEFAVLLGVNQAMVSRYEAGRTRPGYLILSRLLRLAEGAEKNPILDQITRLFGEKERLTEAAALSEFEKMKRGHSVHPTRRAFQPQPAPAGWSVVDEYREFTPNLADLAKTLGQLYTRGREVDASIVQIVQLWLSHDDTDPAVRQCFADAAKYLEVALTMKASDIKRRPEG